MSATAAPWIYVLPLCPLPDVTFFPGTFMPRHVFEPRYRALVTDALARDHRLVVVKLKPGYKETYEAGRPRGSIAVSPGRV